MYFTDTPELRKFEREMQQKPNFDRRWDDEVESESCPSDKTVSTDRKKKGG